MAEANSQSAPANEANKTARPMSFGEKAFDWSVYGFMNYIGTFVLTIPVADSLEFGAFKKPYQAWVKALRGAGLTEKTANIVGRVTTTMQGGNIMIAPIKFAENNKIGIVSALNRWAGDKTDPALIEEAPKQTWGSLITARAVAWTTVFVSFFTAQSLAPKFFDNYEKGFGQWFAKLMKQPTHDALGQPTRAYRYGILGAWDVYATLMAVILLYGGSRIFAKRDAPKEQKTSATTDSSQISLKASVEAEQPKVREQPKVKEHAEIAPKSEIIAGAVQAEKALAAAASRNLEQ